MYDATPTYNSAISRLCLALLVNVAVYRLRYSVNCPVYQVKPGLKLVGERVRKILINTRTTYATNGVYVVTLHQMK